MQNDGYLTFRSQMSSVFPELFQGEDEDEKTGISLCLMPVFQPGLLENLIKEEFGSEGDFPVIGGIRGSQHRGILPTGETWMYFCCSDHMAQRIHFIRNIPEILSAPDCLLSIDPPVSGEPFLSGRLNFSNFFRKKFSYLDIFSENHISAPMLGNFLSTELNLKDLVIPPAVRNGIDEILQWQAFYENKEHTETEFLKRVKKGLKVMFFGKPGTGKTQTAAILGNIFHQKVYRIDLSQVVSKYIGETEKNLSKVFELAETRNWILFFDEGDALFGKRTAVNSSNDRYANQEVAYLLQRMEDYPGIIILSSNLRENIDTAFLRRFQIVTEFPMPDKLQRLQIWKKLLSEISKSAVELDETGYEEIAETELSGGAITNVVNYALMKSCYINSPIQTALLKEGIIRELRKENRLTSMSTV